MRASAGLCLSGSEAANLPQSHVDSDSSSSQSRQETPPTITAAAAQVTEESASSFGPATPPQRRCSSTQVRPSIPSRKFGALHGALEARSRQELRLQRGKKPQTLSGWWDQGGIWKSGTLGELPQGF